MCKYCENPEKTCGNDSGMAKLFEPWGGGMRIGFVSLSNGENHWIIGGGMDESTKYDRMACVEFCPKCGRELD